MNRFGVVPCEAFRAWFFVLTDRDVLNVADKNAK
jgi:hypothetical protein